MYITLYYQATVNTLSQGATVLIANCHEPFVRFCRTVHIAKWTSSESWQAQLRAWLICKKLITTSKSGRSYAITIFKICARYMRTKFVATSTNAATFTEKQDHGVQLHTAEPMNTLASTCYHSPLDRIVIQSEYDRDFVGLGSEHLGTCNIGRVKVSHHYSPWTMDKRPKNGSFNCSDPLGHVHYDEYKVQASTLRDNLYRQPPRHMAHLDQIPS